MTRVLSGAVLIAIAVGAVWFAPPWLFFLVAEALLVLAFVEYARLAEASGFPIPALVCGAATVFASIGVTSTLWIGELAHPAAALDAILLTASVVVAASMLPSWRGERDVIGRVGVAAFPLLYLGLPIGALVSMRTIHGREALALLMLTVIVSDTAQYYSGRLFGRRKLAPAISPKKTVEGAIGGLLFGAIALAAAGAWWLPQLAMPFRALLGVAIVALGITGDLFESMLKRAAGVKDSSTLIPGHGGVLDRIDALLFAAPIYYVVLKLVSVRLLL